MRLSYRWVFAAANPDAGSRCVAAGEFNYRIRLDTGDEMAELGQGDERYDLAISGNFRDDLGPPGAGPHQAGGAQRAIGQRRLPGRPAWRMNQQSACIDRHVRRVTGEPASARILDQSDPQAGPSPPITCG